MRIRPQTQPVGIVSGVKGSKTTFANDSGEDAGLADAPQAGPSRLSNAGPSVAHDDEDDNDDDDDAPEAVGLAQGKKSRVEEEQREAEMVDRKRQAARARSDKIAALKARQKEEAEAKASKDKRKVKAQESDEDEDEDQETRRLRKRMEAAMADGEDESDEDMSDKGFEDDEEESEDADEDDEDEDDGDEEEEDEDEEEEEEEEDDDDDDGSDYSETLQDGPLTDTERQMRERMQAAMEAAEARAGLAPKKPKSALKQTDLTTATSAQETPNVEEESFDLTPYHSTVKPLPQHVLDAAARAQAEKRAAQALAQSTKPNDRELKRKRQRQKAIVRPPPSSRVLPDNKILHLLPTVLDTNSPLPPVIKPGALRPTGPRNTFIKTAMKKSGVGVPGRGLVDGRRKGISSAR